jgi:uncharacterized Rossmann fold enzyme
MQIEEFYIKAKERISNSDIVFIIGGGPSLKETLPDLSVLNNKNLIVTNNAYKLYPNAI